MTFRVDSAYYAIGLLVALRKAGARFTVSVKRTTATWKLLQQIPESAWIESARRPGRRDDLQARRLAPRAAAGDRQAHALHRCPGIGLRAGAAPAHDPPDQLAMLGDGQTSSVHGYSFIATDIPGQTAVWVEHFHRHRAQIEERLKDAKLGQALRRMP